MAVKCIAIGNAIMGDDGIGIKVAEALSQRLIQEHIELILGETDHDYALSKIENGDLLFIIDSSFFEINPGTITYTPISEVIDWHREAYSQHQPSLIYLLKTYGKEVEGYLIGIEVENIDFSLELSDTLKTRFLFICEEVYQFIYQINRGAIMHDTYLLANISKSLNDICKTNKMKRIDQFTLVVNHHSHINEESLREYLEIHNQNCISHELQILIQHRDMEDQTAYIQNIQGETIEQ